jgi:7-carboxy-7-deazaguanine synthase
MTLKVSEVFYSVQGEIDIGMPAVFVRLSGCNLIKDGKGCKFCDSMHAEKGKEMTQTDIIDEISSYGSLNVIITGGECLYQKNDLFPLLVELNEEGWDVGIETNGTIYDQRVLSYVNDINCSPKKQAIRMNVLKQYAKDERTRFKFVYENKRSKWWEQVINILDIAPERVWIMPEGKTRKEQLDKMKEVIEYCKEKGYNFSPRLQVLVWDTKKGV